MRGEVGKRRLAAGGYPKRFARGFEVDADLLQDIKRKDFVASQRFADALACSNELKPLLIDRFKRVAPMIDYLCASLDLDF